MHPRFEHPRAIGSPRTVLAHVLHLLDREPAKTVLDVPTGNGVLVPELLERGYEVSAADIRPDQFEATGVACRRADLNADLPYASDSFDVVLCCNGVHRVHALGRAVRELARVIRPGGRLLLSVPNFTSLSCRIHFFLFGATAPSFVRRMGEAEKAERDSHLRFPVTPAQVFSALESAGLTTRSVQGLRRSPEKIRPARALYLVFVPLVQLVTLLSGRRSAGPHTRRVNSYDLLMKDFIVIEAGKPSGVLAPQ